MADRSNALAREVKCHVIGALPTPPPSRVDSDVFHDFGEAIASNAWAQFSGEASTNAGTDISGWLGSKEIAGIAWCAAPVVDGDHDPGMLGLDITDTQSGWVASNQIAVVEFDFEHE